MSEPDTRPLLMRLPIGSTDPGETYAMPDPDVLGEAFERAYRHRYYGEGLGDQRDWDRVLMLARGYLGLTTYELGQECCVEKLRDIWRARRAAHPERKGR